MNSPAPQSMRHAATALIVTTILVMATLSHHPVVGPASSAQESLSQLAGLQFMDGLVHGMLIVMLSVLSGALIAFSCLLGVRRPAVITACAAWAAGCCVIVAAMLLDGFAVPQLARKYVDASAQDIQSVRVVLGTIGTIIQVLTKAGILAMGVAMLAWSYALVTEKTLGWSRLAATAGIAAALVPCVFILFGDMHLTPHSLMAIFGMYGMWHFAVAAIMLRAGRLQ